ncbi:MAG: Gldg family protein [Planctomycetes bacterium]|nr:Gldg family protein [Planctomycetota bacterium]
MAEVPSPRTATARLGRLGGLGGRTVLWLLLAVIVVAAADRSRAVFDCSADRRFTLSDRLGAILVQQTEPVELVGIWSADDQGRFETIATHLGLMAARNPKIAWRRIDPDLHKAALAQFASLHQQPTWPAVYVTRGTRAYRIPLGDFSRLVLQREVGGALVSLADPHPPRAVIMQGHGELRPEGGMTDGCEVLAHTLTVSGYDVTLDDGSRRSAIPAEATLVIPGPTKPMGEATLAAISQHVRDGGSLLLLADDRAPRDLCVFLRQRGILVASGVPSDSGNVAALLDAQAPTLPPLVVYSRRFYAESGEPGFANHNLLLGHQSMDARHPATAATHASGTNVVSPRTTSVESFTPAWVAGVDPQVAQAFSASGLAPSATASLLVTARGDAWMQPFKPALEAPAGVEQADARVLASALEYPPDERSVRSGIGARIIVWGSRQGASNAVLSQPQFANVDLLRSCVDWLSHRTAPTEIPENEFTAYQVAASDSAIAWLLAILVVVVPCLCLGAAMLTWWDRR